MRDIIDDYRACRICPRLCSVDRYVQKGYCGCNASVRAARAGLHFYEEPFLSGTRGSGTVFFSGCSLGCVYCQNGLISREWHGFDISEERLTEIFLEQQDIRHAHNINLVTGTHFIPSIAEALRMAKDKGLRIPVVWNSSGYERPEYLRYLDGLVDVFLPDFKTLDPDLGARYMHAPDYPERAKEALACMAEMAGAVTFDELSDMTDPSCNTSGQEQVKNNDKEKDNDIDWDRNWDQDRESDPSGALFYEGEHVLMTRGLVVRHLVIPGQTEDSKRVLRYLHDTYGDRIWISLMSQYTPVGRFAEKLHHKVMKATDRALSKVTIPARTFPGGAVHDEELSDRTFPDKAFPDGVFPELFRTVTQEEYDEVVNYAIDLGIENCMIQEGDVADDSFVPAFDGTGICEITTLG